MNNSIEWGLNDEDFGLIDSILESWLPELESKLRAIWRFLRRVTNGKSPEMIREMLPLLGFSIVGDNIEYEFWDFSVKFPIEKCFSRSVSLEFSKSLISEELSDALSDEDFIEKEID